jgi:hypothetical protein
MSPGKQASQAGAAAAMAAGARLEATRRRVRVSCVAVRTVPAAGPIALLLAIASTPTTVGAATRSAARRRPCTRPSGRPNRSQASGTLRKDAVSRGGHELREFSDVSAVRGVGAVAVL